MTNLQSDLDRVLDAIQRYQRLRRFHQPEPFQRQLRELKAWQQLRMRVTYQSLRQEPETAALIEFFLKDIYAGVDLSDVIQRLETLARLAGHLFSDLTLIRLAFEFNTLTAELDDVLTEILVEQGPPQSPSEVTAGAYAVACRQSRAEQAMRRQIDLVAEFARGLDDTLRDPGVVRAFRLARLPARMGGLGSIYDLLARGLDVLQGVPCAERTIQRLVDHEHRILDALMQGETDPFRVLQD